MKVKKILDLNRVKIFCNSQREYIRAARFLSYQTGLRIMAGIEDGHYFPEYPHICVNRDKMIIGAEGKGGHDGPVVNFSDFDLKSIKIQYDI